MFHGPHITPHQNGLLGVRSDPVYWMPEQGLRIAIHGAALKGSVALRESTPED
jgi:hypothetical protein